MREIEFKAVAQILLSCIVILLTFSMNSQAASDGPEEKGAYVPERIVSLAPDITEILFALGLDEEIAGVTEFSSYPEAAQRKPKVGSYINLSIERIVILKPDLVIGTANGNKRDTINQLARIGIPVHIINPAAFEDLFHTILEVGKITGRSSQAHRIVDDLCRRVDYIRCMMKSAKRPRVFFQIGIHPIITVGNKTIHHSLIEIAGGLNVMGETEILYPKVNIEQIIASAPDVILVSSMKRGGDFEAVKKEWKRWKEIPAVKNDKIFIVDSDLTDRFSPRIVEGLERIAALLHPEIPDR
ncbi:MAG: cobalamin-binding protein [Desulforhabdus sp.]|jgi:iron complex transport system substrate-binding protein|nr:cobalamin-binding protein [Desulforhabdus sp.]